LSNFILRLIPYSQYDDKALFSQIAEGDEKAFTELFHTYTPKLLPFVFKLTRNEHLAQEMIQETFLKLWVNRAALVNVNEPASWIFRIAANVSVTYLRKQSNRERLLNAVKPDEASDTVVDKLETKELTLIINKAVEALPDRRKEIYRLSREQGLNHQQIAEKLQLSTNTVANQIGISLKFIREFINKETGLSMLTLLILFGR
jgi:RNA polymerase sigma-70 factor (family 1)